MVLKRLSQHFKMKRQVKHHHHHHRQRRLRGCVVLVCCLLTLVTIVVGVFFSVGYKSNNPSPASPSPVISVVLDAQVNGSFPPFPAPGRVASPPPSTTLPPASASPSPPPTNGNPQPVAGNPPPLVGTPPPPLNPPPAVSPPPPPSGVAAQSASVQISSSSVSTPQSLLGQAFFGTVTAFDTLNTNTSNWNGNQGTDVTAGVVGGWIQGTFSAPFAAAAWFFVGFSPLPYLMGSNDGSTFTNVSMSVSSSSLCAVQLARESCFYATSPLPIGSQPTFSIYRVVSTDALYNYAITLLTIALPQPSPPPAAQASPPPAIVSPPPPVLSPPPPVLSPPPPVLSPPPPTTSPPPISGTYLYTGKKVMGRTLSGWDGSGNAVFTPLFSGTTNIACSGSNHDSNYVPVDVSGCSQIALSNGWSIMAVQFNDLGAGSFYTCAGCGGPLCYWGKYTDDPGYAYFPANEKASPLNIFTIGGTLQEPPIPLVSGYDILVVAGQSNTVGFASAGHCSVQDAATKQDQNYLWSTYDLPIYYLNVASNQYESTQSRPDWFVGTQIIRTAKSSDYQLPTTGSPECSVDYIAKFTQNYVASGKLASGRGLLVVKTAWSGTPMAEGASSSPVNLLLPPGSTVHLDWVTSTSCNALYNYQFATSINDANLNMNLFTHATYRIDYAMGIDPSTNQYSNSLSWGSTHPQNKIVGYLFHQGESDQDGGVSISAWGNCLTIMINTWRTRYAGPKVPFIVGTWNQYYPQTGLNGQYRDWMRLNFGNNNFLADGSTSSYNQASTPASAGLQYVGLADALSVQHFDTHTVTLLGTPCNLDYQANGGASCDVTVWNNPSCPFTPTLNLQTPLPNSGSCRIDMTAFSPATMINTQHFSWYGYQQLSQRFWDAFNYVSSLP